MDKVKALLLDNITGSQVDLGDVQLESVAQFINEGSYISTYGSALPIAEVAQGSVTVNKNVAGTIEDKTSIGQGTINNAKVSQVTVFMGTSKKINEGLTQADMSSGFASAVAVKSAKHADQLRKFRERNAFLSLASSQADTDGTKVGATLPTTVDEAYKVYLQIVSACEKIAELVDEDQAIDTVDESMIFIDIKPVWFSALVRLGFASGAGKEMFENGRFNIANLGGYTIRSNPLLVNTVSSDGTPVVGFVSTTFTGLAPMRMTALNAGRFDASNDVVVYSEAKFTSDEKGVLKGFTKVYDNVTTNLLQDAI